MRIVVRAQPKWKAPPGFYKKRGQCYYSCGMYMLENKPRKLPSGREEMCPPVLVHGKFRNPDGAVIDHAWIERCNEVMDIESGESYPQFLYYRQATPVRKFNYKQVWKIANQKVKAGESWGPWY